MLWSSGPWPSNGWEWKFKSWEFPWVQGKQTKFLPLPCTSLKHFKSYVWSYTRKKNTTLQTLSCARNRNGSHTGFLVFLLITDLVFLSHLLPREKKVSFHHGAPGLLPVSHESWDSLQSVAGSFRWCFGASWSFLTLCTTGAVISSIKAFKRYTRRKISVIAKNAKPERQMGCEATLTASPGRAGDGSTLDELQLNADNCTWTWCTLASIHQEASAHCSHGCTSATGCMHVLWSTTHSLSWAVWEQRQSQAYCSSASSWVAQRHTIWTFSRNNN